MAGIIHALNAVHSFCALHQGTWILDSGASGHMSSEQSTLHDLVLIKNSILVNLPNGAQVRVTHKGKLRIAKKLVLNDVLLVPNFKFSLLSIKKLCKPLHCRVAFIKILCIL